MLASNTSLWYSLQRNKGEESKYIDRHVLRKILCEDQGCVDEIAHIINKQESVIKRRIEELKMKGLLKEDGDHFALNE